MGQLEGKVLFAGVAPTRPFLRRYTGEGQWQLWIGPCVAGDGRLGVVGCLHDLGPVRAVEVLVCGRIFGYVSGKFTIGAYFLRMNA